jgi:hypothetical protein
MLMVQIQKHGVDDICMCWNIPCEHFTEQFPYLVAETLNHISDVFHAE